MKLQSNSLTQALKLGKSQIGIWISLANPFSAEVIAPAGFDWALIDMEHTPNDYFSVLGQLQAFAATNTIGLVRPEWNDPVVIKRLMDLGAQGFVFPMIQSVQEAEKAVASTRYPPRGNRGVSGSTRATKFGRITDYVDRVEDETTVILQLETADAVAKAEDIAAVDGVSGVFFGPADISADIGKSGNPMDPAVWALIKPVAQKLISKGVPVGTLVSDTDFAGELINEGFTFVACGIDTVILARGVDAALASVKKKMKE